MGVVGMRIWILGVVLLAGCGGGTDGLSDIVGPNPISDVRSVWDAMHDDGWSDTQVAEVRGLLQGLGATATEAECIAAGFAEEFTAEEFSQTTGEEPEILAAIEACLGPM